MFAALQVSHPLVPVPGDGEWQRTPWSRQALAAARTVLVAHPGNPEPAVTAHGVELELVKPDCIAGQRVRVSLYRQR